MPLIVGGCGGNAASTAAAAAALSSLFVLIPGMLGGFGNVRLELRDAVMPVVVVFVSVGLITLLSASSLATGTASLIARFFLWGEMSSSGNVMKKRQPKVVPKKAPSTA